MVAELLCVLLRKANFWRNLNTDHRMRIEKERLNKINENKEMNVNALFSLSPRIVLNSLWSYY
jgi:hypothetical protein